jgi:type II secretory pathway component PulC
MLAAMLDAARPPALSRTTSLRRGLGALVLAAACGTSPASKGAAAPDEPLIDENAERNPQPPRADEAADAPRPARTIYRDELVRALGQGPAYLLRQLGPEPHRPQGKWVGWRITRVFPDDPGLCRGGCDLLVGDVVLSVNGNTLERPEQLSDLVQALPSATTLVVERLRGGAYETVEWRLADAR